MSTSVFDVEAIRYEFRYTSGTIKQIAERNGINFNTLRSYAYRHNWNKRKRRIKKLDRVYNQSDYSDIPYRAIVFAIMIGYYGWKQDFAYYHCYCTKPENSRVNAYRLLRRDDIKELIAKCNDIKLNGGNLLKELPFNCGLPVLDAEMLNDSFEFWNSKFGYSRYCFGGSSLHQKGMAFRSMCGFK